MKQMARTGLSGCLLAVLLLVFAPPLGAAEHDLEKCKAQFVAGEYQDVIEKAGAAVRNREREEDWVLLYANALWMTGKYPEARDAIKSAQRFNYYAVRTRLLGYKLCRSVGELEEAANLLDEINSLGGSR